MSETLTDNRPDVAERDTPVITPAANRAQGYLPIRDIDSLRAALDVADVPTMLMVYTQLTGDESLLGQFKPHIKPLMQGGSAGIPEDLKAALRDSLFEVLTSDAIPADELPSQEAIRRMMDTYVGENVADEFVPLLLEQSGLTGIQGVDISKRQKPPADFKVLVIGAGMSGIALGAKLAEAGYDYTIIEREDEVGGTWYHTTYPGLAVDTPSHFYSFSFELNADWSHWFSRGYENQAYLLHCARKFGVRDRTRFRTEVTKAVWDDKDAMWDVTVRSLEDGSEQTLRANAVISALGFNNRPRKVEIPGVDDFKGAKMHSAEWDETIELKGKRIGLIGTGASAMQIAPQMAKVASHLTVF